MVSDEEKNKKEDSLSQDQEKEITNKEDNKAQVYQESPVTYRIRHNPWILSTIVLGILVVILLAGVFDSTANGDKEANIQNVGEKVESFYGHYGIEGATVSNVEVSDKDDYFYKVELSYKGREIPFFVTSSGYIAGNSLTSVIPNEDGSYNVPGMNPVSKGQANSSTESVSENTAKEKQINSYQNG